ncbi:hypothetical protein [Spiroplasma endosymbiont of Amphimallon solstitiale]
MNNFWSSILFYIIKRILRQWLAIIFIILFSNFEFKLKETCEIILLISW